MITVNPELRIERAWETMAHPRVRHWPVVKNGTVLTMTNIETVTRTIPQVAVIMGSQSDWETLRHASTILTELAIVHENRIVSAHRTPDLLFSYVSGAAARGIQVIIAGAGGAAHLPGMAAAKTTLPVLGVPVQSRALQGLDSLLSIVQMPKGIPVGTLAIGEAGAANAALLAAAILALCDPALRERLQAYRQRQTEQVLEQKL